MNRTQWLRLWNNFFLDITWQYLVCTPACKIVTTNNWNTNYDCIKKYIQYIKICVVRIYHFTNIFVNHVIYFINNERYNNKISLASIFAGKFVFSGSRIHSKNIDMSRAKQYQIKICLIIFCSNAVNVVISVMKIFTWNSGSLHISNNYSRGLGWMKPCLMWI